MHDQNNGKIIHVSDTAILVATHRAIETNRKDALFKDPYAELLSGERGREIVKSLEQGKGGAWGTITRTVAFDEMIMRAIREGADTVVNLAAGLDTRPYRLDIPSSLRWIEVDFPDIIAYKTEKLASEQPRCSLERVPLDLAEQYPRKKLFDRINQEGKKVLVVAEGFLVYLKKDDVTLLAKDLYGEQNFRWWLADVITPELLAWSLKNNFKSPLTGDVRVHFAPEDRANFFGQYGWKITAARTMSEEGRRLKREPQKPWPLKLLKSLMSV